MERFLQMCIRDRNKDGTLSITGTDDKIAAEGGEVEGEKEPFICELACE